MYDVFYARSFPYRFLVSTTWIHLDTEVRARDVPELASDESGGQAR